MKIGKNDPRFLDIFLVLVVLVLMWIFVACQPVVDDVKGVGTTQMSSPSAITPISSKETVGTLVTPTVTVPNNISMVMPIPSLMPTLSLAEKRNVISELYETNGNCELPCWWGIVPGETEWQTAEHFLSTIAVEISTNAESETDPYYSTSVTVPVPEDLSEISLLKHTFIVEGGIIVEIKPEGPWGARKVDTVSEILSTYGRPPEVWLETWGYTFGSYYPFAVALSYPEQGILVIYFDQGKLKDGYVIGCLQERSGKLTLWSPKQEITFIESLGQQQDQYYKPLQEATEMDVEAFYQTYLDPDTETCITTPAELWMQ
jgi:hypothetical protein